MAVFNISFRIKQAGDHVGRYESVVQTIQAQAKGERSWEETTSFFVLESDLSAQALCDEIYVRSKFNADWDKMLVVNLSVKEHATKGAIEYPNTLSALMNLR